MGWTVGHEAGEALKEIRGEAGCAHDPKRLPHPYEEIWASFPEFLSQP